VDVKSHWEVSGEKQVLTECDSSHTILDVHKVVSYTLHRVYEV